MKNYTITEEQIKELAKGNKKVEKMFPDVFDSKFELNKWYKIKHEPDNKSLVFFNKIVEKKLSGFGFIYNGKWDDEITTYRNFYELELATEEEVKSALIKEAERRGFKNGVYVNNSMIEFNGCTPDISKRCKLDFKLGYSPFEQFNDLRLKGTTPCKSAFIIFKDGVWAEVIKSKYLTKKQAEERLTELENDGYEYQIID